VRLIREPHRERERCEVCGAFGIGGQGEVKERKESMEPAASSEDRCKGEL
jgi:hypothetical protein